MYLNVLEHLQIKVIQTNKKHFQIKKKRKDKKNKKLKCYLLGLLDVCYLESEVDLSIDYWFGAHSKFHEGMPYKQIKSELLNGLVKAHIWILLKCCGEHFKQSIQARKHSPWHLKDFYMENSQKPWQPNIWDFGEIMQSAHKKLNIQKVFDASLLTFSITCTDIFIE